MELRLKVLSIALILASTVVIGGWSCGDINAAEGSVKGRVVRASDATPIAGAIVSVGSEGAVTDAFGSFQIGEIDTGRRQLRVKADGYCLPGEPLFVSVAEDVLRDLGDFGLVPVSEAPPDMPPF